VDELRDSVTRACRHAKGTLLTSADLPRHLHLAMDAALYPPAEEPKIELDGVLEGVERELLARALHEARGNRAEAARRLGISRNRLLRRIDFFKLT
jgi:DNA-binding NtrC family response regulator